jgi:hypothetical protein
MSCGDYFLGKSKTMKKTLLIPALAAMAFAGQAHAFTYFTVGATSGPGPGDPGLASGENAVVTFDSANAAGVTETTTGTVDHPTGTSGSAAAPAGDSSIYEALGTNGSATFDFSGYVASHIVNTVSVYLGSIDSYNYINILGAGGAVVGQITGSDLPQDNGDQGASITNRRLYIDLTPTDGFTGLQFFSQGVAFEYDTIAATARTFTVPNGGVLSAVPEPTTWAMMLLGIGGVGLMLRRKKTMTRTLFA